MATTNATGKRTCFCYACRGGGFKRSELTPDFLCPSCAAMPGACGYRDPSKRGLDGGSPAYWEATKNQLNVVTDDEQTPGGNAPLAAPTRRRDVWRWNEARGDFDVTDEPVPTLGGTLGGWQRDVLADPELSAEVKVVLIRLSFHGDHVTGGNIWPSRATLAREIGRSLMRTRRLLAETSARGWVAVWQCESWNGRAYERKSNRYQLRWPDGRCLAPDDRRL